MKKKIIVLITLVIIALSMILTNFGIETIRENKGTNNLFEATVYYNSTDTISILVKGTDSNYYRHFLSTSNLVVKVGGTVQPTTSWTLAQSSTSSTGVIMLVTLKNATAIGQVTLEIPANTLEDTNGNKNVATTITTDMNINKGPLASLITAANYGDPVDYTANDVSDWKIFLKDSDNYVYIIPTEVVPNSGYTGPGEDGDYRVHGTGRDTFVTWLQTSANWSAYASGKSNNVTLNAGLATGGPTKPQFWESYNAKYGTSYSADYQTGLDTANRLYFPSSIMDDTRVDRLYSYWLASPCSGHSDYVERVYCEGYVGNYFYSTNFIGVRPLVRLPSGIEGIYTNNKWVLSN